MTDLIAFIYDDIVDTFVKRKCAGACLAGSIIFAKRLKDIDIDVEVIEGFNCFKNNSYARHYWVIVHTHSSEKIYDIGKGIMHKLMPITTNIDSVLVTTIHKDCKRIDMDTSTEIYELKEMETMFQNYQTKGDKCFFKIAPRWMYRLANKSI